MTAMPHQVPGGDARASDDFMLVRPDTVRRVGNGNAALVYARIEFRCAQPGQDRIEDETGRWWRASVNTISADTGLSIKMVRTALDGLERQSEIEVFKHRAGGVSDQTASYRPTPLPAIRPNGQMDSPKLANGRSSACPSGQIDSPTRADHHLPLRANVPSIEELEEGVARARAEQASHDPASEPPRRCPKHLHDDNPPNCHACGQARRAHETWQTDQQRAERQAVSDAAHARAELTRQQIDACDLCDETGYRGLAPCDHNPDQDETNARGREKAWAAIGGRKPR
ncbi:hypothetical protein GS446_05385 [Rhodococcus hoagii]|nr:hypothetical protein [Prescottella equi]